MKPCNYNCEHMSIRYDKHVYAYCNKYDCRLAMDGGGTVYAVAKCVKGERENEYGRTKKLFELLQNGILDLDIRNYDAEVTTVKIAELADRLIKSGVTVEETLPQF